MQIKSIRENTKFTVIIPLFNKEYSVVNSINSVLNQTYGAFQIIIVNDGSTDSSFEKVQANFKREITSGFISVIDQSNQGVSIARNVGVKKSLSEYICFLDADDEWKSNYLEEMLSLLKKCPDADLYCLAHYVRKKNNPLSKPKHGLPDNFYGYVENFFSASIMGSVANSSKVCIKKNALLNIGGFPAGVVQSEDLFVWMMLALKGKVACKMTYSVIINQVPDSARSSRLNEVPYPLVYLSENKICQKPTGFNGYIFSIFGIHFLHSLYHFRLKEACLRLYYYLKIYL